MIIINYNYYFQSILTQQLHDGDDDEETTEIDYSISSSSSSSSSNSNNNNIGDGIDENSLKSLDTSTPSLLNDDNQDIDYNHTREALSHEASEHESVSTKNKIVHLIIIQSVT